MQSDTLMHMRRRMLSLSALPPGLGDDMPDLQRAVLSIVGTLVSASYDASVQISPRRLGKMLGCTDGGAKRALDVARESGWLTVTPMCFEDGRAEANKIEIISPEWRQWLRMVEPH